MGVLLDSNSAADADLWIAYSLIEAGQFWEKPEYTTTGKALLSLIAQEEVATVPRVGHAPAARKKRLPS